MTTKELINQYVTAHADNRWMDASELEVLLTEFAEELMKDAIECEVRPTEVEGIELDSVEICSDGLMLDNKKYKAGDKVKVIIIKE